MSGFQVLLFFVFKARWIELYELGWNKSTVMRLNLPSDEANENPDIIAFSGPDILREWKITKKKIITIDLTGQKQEDEKRIEFIRMEARRLKYTYDTTSIIKVHFTDENTYGQFVELVNIMNKDLHKRYMLYNDDFYILGEEPPDPMTILPF